MTGDPFNIVIPPRHRHERLTERLDEFNHGNGTHMFKTGREKMWGTCKACAEEQGSIHASEGHTDAYPTYCSQCGTA